MFEVLIKNILMHLRIVGFDVKFFDQTIAYLRKSFQLQFERRNFTTHQ